MMKQLRVRLIGRGIVLFASFLFLMTNAAAVYAEASGPETPQSPIHVPDQPLETPDLAPEQEPLAQAPGALALPAMKAVLIVGPIDGDTGQWTTDEIKNMELAAAELAANGVRVFKFYTPNNNWDQIKAAAIGAHFLMYRGHGVYWGEMPHPPVGGFALKDKLISNDEIRRDLKLAPNAIIMVYGCFTAGSAGNDTASISLTEAKRRVSMYSKPFFENGAGGYYADWFGDAFQMYVRYLFQGKTQRQAYESYHDFNQARISRSQHNDLPAQAMWLGWDEWYAPSPQYNNSFVGQPDKRLADLFGARAATNFTEQVFLPMLENKQR